MPSTPPQPRRGKFSQTVSLTWTDATPFNGWILVGLIMPQTGGVDWPEVEYGNQQPTQRVPVFAFIPIIFGTFHPYSTLLFNADIVPPNSQYVAWYYDSAKQRIAGPTTAFTVSTDPFTPPLLTLTAPTPGTTLPVPDG